MQQLHSTDQFDENYIRVKYIRYADDWLIGVVATKTKACEIKEEIKTFLGKELNLKLSEEKTKITNAHKDYAYFLGTKIKCCRNVKHKKKVKKKGRTANIRTVNGHITIHAPIKELINKLKQKGYCNQNGYPIFNKHLLQYSIPDIIKQYSSINRGIQNYYRFTEEFHKLTRVQYILKYSLAKTLAGKHRTSIRKIFKRYGENITYTYENQKGKQTQTSMWLNHNWKKNRYAFRTVEDREPTEYYQNQRSKTYLKAKVCCICGKTSDTEMHHLRHIRKMNQKLNGFDKIMAQLNRKQIPVCKECHKKIHSGKYDGMKLSELYYQPV